MLLLVYCKEHNRLETRRERALEILDASVERDEEE